MPEIRVNGVTLYYEEHGAGAPILGVHGTGSSSAFWSEPSAELAKRGRAIIYDRRGCFRSERPEPYETNVAQQADDAAELMDALAAAPAIVIGRSYGADIAVDLALRYPDRVRGLVLVEGIESLTEDGAQWLEDLEMLALAAAAADIDLVGETLYRAVLGDDGWNAFPKEAQELVSSNGPAIVAEFRGGFLRVTPEQLREIEQPALVVSGKDSPPVYAEVTRVLAASLPSGEVEWVEGGHAVNPAHPSILRFLDEVLAGG